MKIHFGNERTILFMISEGYYETINSCYITPYDTCT